MPVLGTLPASPREVVHKRLVALLTLFVLAAPAPAVSGDAPKVQVTGVMLAKFAPARQRELDETIAFLREVKERGAARQKVGRQATPSDAEDLKRRTKVHEDAIRQVERDSGLSADDWTSVRRLVDDVGGERSAWRLAGGDEGIARTEASLEKQLASLPPAQRAAILENMTGKLKQARRADKARKARGDALVAAALPLSAPIEAKKQEALRLGMTASR